MVLKVALFKMTGVQPFVFPKIQADLVLFIRNTHYSITIQNMNGE